VTGRAPRPTAGSTSSSSPAHDAPGGTARGVLVVGYGNPLRGDDGVGRAVAVALAAARDAGDPRLAGATILALHQLAPEVAVDLATAGLAIFVDATVEAEPGAIRVRHLGPGAQVTVGGGVSVGGGASSHHVDPGVLLVLARDLYGSAPDALVVSVGAADMEVDDALTAPVEAAVPAAVEAVAALVAEHRGSGRG
jgi:hydrogenase maturation protease